MKAATLHRSDFVQQNAANTRINKLQPFRRCGFPSGRAHPLGKSRIQNFRRLHDGLRGPDTRASYMEIACIRFTIQTTDVMVRTCQALIWKLHAARVRLSGRQGNTV
jgi:hypothetical protein